MSPEILNAFEQLIWVCSGRVPHVKFGEGMVADLVDLLTAVDLANVERHATAVLVVLWKDAA